MAKNISSLFKRLTNWSTDRLHFDRRTGDFGCDNTGPDPDSSPRPDGGTTDNDRLPDSLEPIDMKAVPATRRIVRTRTFH